MLKSGTKSREPIDNSPTVNLDLDFFCTNDSDVLDANNSDPSDASADNVILWQRGLRGKGRQFIGDHPQIHVDLYNQIDQNKNMYTMVTWHSEVFIERAVCERRLVTYIL